MTSPIAPLLRGMADDSSEQSLSHRLRERRFQLFDGLASSLPRPLRVIDVGGTNDFWEQRGWAGRDDVSVTLVNVVEQERRHENAPPVVGDATSLAGHAENSYDIAFSNSVIEHLFTLDSQAAMASVAERFGGLVKSWTAIAGFPAAAEGA